MKKLVHPLVALVVLALGVVIVPPAQAAPYTPETGLLFNDPVSPNRAEQYKLMSQIENAVDNVPAGSYIRFITYSFDLGDIGAALIDAHKRGVNVRLLIDSHTETSTIRTVRDELKKSYGLGNKSYLKTCKFSCMSNTTSYIHSKIYMFSRVGNAKYVSMISSANLAETGVSRSWNNTYTIVNNKTIYDANKDNFNDMLPDKTNTDYYHTVVSGKYKEYYFPRAGSTPKSDTIYNILSDVSCSDSTGHQTKIKLATYNWTTRRLYIADKLTALRKKGCDIQVLYPDGAGGRDTVWSEVANTLLDGGVPAHNALLDRNGSVLYTHSKYVLIDGVYQGVPNQKLVYSTSQNLTNNSLRESNEVILRIMDAGVHDAYVRNFERIWNDWSVPVTKKNVDPAGSLSNATESVRDDAAPDPFE
jgi:phosphatidylserine/phosphatidylglycerophosphate/cardiolipin synthase-like enzyme